MNKQLLSILKKFLVFAVALIKTLPVLLGYRFEYSLAFSESWPDKLSLVINVLLAFHTAAYEKMKKKKLFTAILLAVIFPLFVLNSFLYLHLYLARKRVFWNFTFFWVGTLISYLAFYSFQEFWVTGNTVLICSLMGLYVIICLRRAMMHYLYNFNSIMRHYELSNEAGCKLITIRGRKFLPLRFTIADKQHLWWNLKFRSLNYQVRELENLVMIGMDNFECFFKEDKYDSEIVGNLLTLFTDKNYEILSVAKYGNEVVVKYKEGNMNTKGHCYNAIKSSNIFKRVYFEYHGCMSLDNHVSNEKTCGVKKFLFVIYFNQGWYKKLLSEIRPSSNTCEPLEPLGYEDRIKKKNEFIESLQKSGNTIRLSNYLEQCINWYHNRQFKKVATVEYRYRWSQHREWIIGSPIIEEKVEDKIIIERVAVFENQEKIEKLKKTVTFEHVPVLNPGESPELQVNLIPNSYSTPAPVHGRKHNRDVLVPAPGYKLKDYKANVVRLCTCGEVENFPIVEHERRYSKEAGLVNIGNLVKKVDSSEVDYDHVKKVRVKVKEYAKIKVKKSNDKQERRVKIKDVFPNILSEKSVKKVIPVTRTQRNIFVEKERQAHKAVKKEVMRHNKNLIKIDKERYSKKKRFHKHLRPGLEIRGKEIIIKKVDTEDIQDLFNKILSSNKFPKCNVSILENLHKNHNELKKIYRISKKEIFFIKSTVAYEYTEILN